MTQADFTLLQAFVADRITAEELPQLEALLRSSRAARRAVIGLVTLEEGLEQIAATALSVRFFGPQAGSPAAAPATAARPSLGESISDSFAAMVAALFRPAVLRGIGFSLAALAGCLLIAAIAWRGLRPVRPRLPAGVLAQVVAVGRPAWATDAQPRHEGDSLPAGGLLAIEAGLVEILFASGAAVVLEGPAVFEIIDGGAGKLGRGRLAATLDRPTGPFAIHTPSAVITDRGTQFGVEVDAAGKTDVRVFQGFVDLAAVAALRMASPIRLSAGDSGEIAPDGGIARIDAAAPKKFVMTVPREAKPQPPRPLPFAWDDSRAVVLYRDAFAGAGSLGDSAAASRGGVGESRWLAPADGWQFDPETKSLSVTATGAAFQPFKPEPGHVYRLSVTMDVTAGGIGWAAIGFATAANTRLATLDHAWMLKRHDTKTQANAAYAGPQTAGQAGRGDRRTGVETRTVVLDTTAPRWKAFFLAGDDVIGQCDLDQPPGDIAHVAISVFPNTMARFRDFSLRAIRTIR